MTDFSKRSSRYEQNSLVQKSAAQTLIALLAIGAEEDVLDLGCGSGGLTKTLRGLTRGRVLGVDSAAGMLAQARQNSGDDSIEFVQSEAGGMDFDRQFDIVFCNSAFQWFREPAPALEAIRRALRPGGRVGVQAPATRNYCPNFLRAVAAAWEDPDLAPFLAAFDPPWLFLDTERQYSELFQAHGFRVTHCRLETIRGEYAAAQALAIFSTGAAAGYLNPACYRTALPGWYAERFLERVGADFSAQAKGGDRLELVFTRIFLTAVRN
ncbi:methyltransferase domain-containing protein [bacterium]|nr:methyltransferase domain-containing protein [bacterium]